MGPWPRRTSPGVLMGMALRTMLMIMMMTMMASLMFMMKMMMEMAYLMKRTLTGLIMMKCEHHELCSNQIIIIGIIFLSFPGQWFYYEYVILISIFKHVS